MREDSRTAIVFVHGMFGTPENWTPCAAALGAEFTILTPRLPLFEGETAGDVLVALVNFVRQQLDRHSIERAILVGNSLGGHIAALVALREPQRVAGLVLTGSSGLFEKIDGTMTRRRPDREWLRTKAAAVFFDPRKVTEETVDEVERIVRNPRTAMRLLQLAKAAKRDSLRPLLNGIRCPALLVWGAEDQITPASTGFEFHDLLPRSELVFLRQCGHAPMIERPEEFSRVLKRFVRSLAAEALGLQPAPAAQTSRRLTPADFDTERRRG
jgi:pimeloyl-ACP methyl ester carboxylesterase